MKSARSKATKAKPAPRRIDRGIPFDEMRRLMRVYGSLKCLRNRKGSTGEDFATMKIESVKRKFYRWFPDLDERFEKNAEGQYVPKLGHEAELRYREESRTNDGKTLTTKRAKRRRENFQQTKVGRGKAMSTRPRAVSGSGARAASGRPNVNQRARPPTSVSPDLSKSPLVHNPLLISPQGRASSAGVRVTPAPASFPPSGGSTLLRAPNSRVDINRSASVVSDANPKQAGINAPAKRCVSTDEDTLGSFSGEEGRGDVSIQLQFDHDLVSSADIVVGAEPVDRSFIAEEGIFDDVEKDFFGAARPRSPTASPTSSLSSRDHDTSTASLDDDCFSIEDVIEKSIEECYEELLGEDDSAAWLF